MSAPYLNRGESIILTTHRLSVNSILFDAMLTNERLVLMDNRYIRFEPRMILFPGVISIKGGKVPTGEPAIIFTLEEPSDLSGSQQINLIFTQQPGEHRTHERELWMKKLIELVITAREQAAQKTIIPARKKTGMQPAIRRWVAPEPLRPHSSVIEPAPLPPAVVVTSEEPDSLEFFLENMRPKDHGTPKEERADVPPAPEILPAMVETAGAPEEEELPPAVTLPETQPEEPVTAHEMPERDEETSPDEIPGAGSSLSPENTPVEPLPTAIPEPPEPAEGAGPSVPFESTVLAAVQSLQSHAESQEQQDRSAIPDTREPAPVASSEIPGHDATSTSKNREIAEDQDIPEKTPVPDSGRHLEPVPVPGPTAMAQMRELPGTYTPDIPVTGITTGPQGNELPATSPDSQKSVKGSRAGRPAIIAGVALIIVMLALIGGAAFLSLQGQAGGNLGVVISTAITVPQTPSPGPVTVLPTGVRVKVIYPGTFTGTIGNPGLLRQVSGSGNQTFPILMTDSIIQTTIQKHDNSGAALTVEIYNNSTLLAHRTVTSPTGEIDLLIDTKTARPPGMTTPPSGNRTLPGNGTLVYY